MKIKNKMIVDTNLDMFDYIATVNEIADEYFDVDGNYQPHVGLLNAMRVFYNKCVKVDLYNVSHDTIDPTDMEQIVKDPTFIEEFNKAININDLLYIQMDFENAFSCAMNIVETKRNSFERVIDMAKKSMETIMRTINPLLSDENLSLLTEISKNVGNGKIDANAIVDAYAKSSAFKAVKEKADNEEN